MWSYVQRKYTEATNGVNPFTVSSSFYELCKAVADVTHELFADAINHSRVLQNFYSFDTCGSLAFGASGAWEDADDKVASGAGYLSFEDTIW